MENAAVFDGNTSKSNGSMMRATPLGVYGYKLTDDELALIAASDSDLSHGNQTVQQAVACYIIAIAELIKTGNIK